MYVLGEASSAVLESVFFPGRAINQLEINPPGRTIAHAEKLLRKSGGAAQEKHG